MRPVLLLALSFLACGCTVSRPILSGSSLAKVGHAEDDLPVTPRVLEQLPPGRKYRIRTNDPRKSYVGRVVESGPEKLVLADVAYEQRTESRTPVLGSVPLLGKAFSKDGVRVSQLYGDWTFTRPQITAVELLGSPVPAGSEVAGPSDSEEAVPDSLVGKPKRMTGRDG